MSIAAISKRIWSLCHVLRDDGIVYHKYLSELTYLLFLKSASETGKEDLLPPKYRWKNLTTQPSPGMLSYYRKMLTSLGEDANEEIVREIFRFPTTVFNHEENLRKVVEGIDAIDWHEALSDGLGAVYESLLQRNASEARSGAGQYFTPRPLVDAMVKVLKPDLGETIQDPAAGTAGFLISAQSYIRERHNSAAYVRNSPRFQAVEIEGDTYRLCLMNMFLHGMQGKVIHGDALTHDVDLLRVVGAPARRHFGHDFDEGADNIINQHRPDFLTVPGILRLLIAKASAKIVGEDSQFRQLGVQGIEVRNGWRLRVLRPCGEHRSLCGVQRFGKALQGVEDLRFKPVGPASGSCSSAHLEDRTAWLR